MIDSYLNVYKVYKRLHMYLKDKLHNLGIFLKVKLRIFQLEIKKLGRNNEIWTYEVKHQIFLWSF